MLTQRVKKKTKMERAGGMRIVFKVPKMTRGTRLDAKRIKKNCNRQPSKKKPCWDKEVAKKEKSI